MSIYKTSKPHPPPTGDSWSRHVYDLKTEQVDSEQTRGIIYAAVPSWAIQAYLVHKSYHPPLSQPSQPSTRQTPFNHAPQPQSSFSNQFKHPAIRNLQPNKPPLHLPSPQQPIGHETPPMPTLLNSLSPPSRLKRTDPLKRAA
jgi:hypothetical protein